MSFRHFHVCKCPLWAAYASQRWLPDGPLLHTTASQGRHTGYPINRDISSGRPQIGLAPNRRLGGSLPQTSHLKTVGRGQLRIKWI